MLEAMAREPNERERLGLKMKHANASAEERRNKRDHVLAWVVVGIGVNWLIGMGTWDFLFSGVFEF